MAPDSHKENSGENENGYGYEKNGKEKRRCSISRNRGIQNHKFWFFFSLLQKLFHVFVVGNNSDTCYLCVGVEIACRGQIGIHAQHSLKRLCQRQCEEPDSRI